MILADKIIELRKRIGMTQEDLAEALDVSRQSISKWESAQSVPDMNRILKLSEVFGVSTDCLLRDDLDLSARENAALSEDPGQSLRTVSMEEASAFLAVRDRNAASVSLGVMLCILSPIVLILLSALQASGRAAALTEASAVGIGLTVMILFIGAAVALFVTSGMRSAPFEYMEKEPIDTAYGVSGMARDRLERTRPAFARQIVTGVTICVLSAVPLFLSMIAFGENDLAQIVSVCVLLAVVSIGACVLIRALTPRNACQILLEEGDYTRAAKEAGKKTGWIPSAYWLAVTAGFLLYSFRTNDWSRSWIIWAIAALVFAILMAALNGLSSRR